MVLVRSMLSLPTMLLVGDDAIGWRRCYRLLMLSLNSSSDGTGFPLRLLSYTAAGGTLMCFCSISSSLCKILAMGRPKADAPKKADDRLAPKRKATEKLSKLAKKGKAGKDPNNPKRPASAFFMFMDEFRKEFKEKIPNNKAVTIVSKAGGDKWKSLTEAICSLLVHRLLMSLLQSTRDRLLQAFGRVLPLKASRQKATILLLCTLTLMTCVSHAWWCSCWSSDDEPIISINSCGCGVYYVMTCGVSAPPRPLCEGLYIKYGPPRPLYSWSISTTLSSSKQPAMAESSEAGQGEYTKDGSVDLNGNPVLRLKCRGWTACSFVVVYEVFDRMAYYGISTNLVLYLTNKLHQGTVKSANNVTNWVGTVWMTPIIGAYVADTYLGRYWTFLVASAIYLMGMFLLTLAVSLPSLKPPRCGPGTGDPNCTSEASALQLGVFFAALYILAVGTGGTKPNISTMGADQFDEFDPKERAHKLSFFNWWMFSIFLGTLFANTVLVYVQDNVGWTLGYALPTVGLAVSIAIFIAGTPFYRHKPPAGSAFSKMARVLVAAARNCAKPSPTDPKELYELDVQEYAVNGKFRIDPSPTLKYLNKAAIKAGSNSLWKQSPVTHVEETKLMLKMIPVLFATFIPSIMVAQVNTLFIKQGTTLNRHMGSGFQIPPACLAAFVTVSMLLTVVLYDKYFVPTARRITGNPRGISLLQRLGTGMAIHVVIMLVAALTERARLRAARKHGLVETGGTIPMSIFVLLPQFLLMGVADAFLEVAKIEFFYDQAPEGMKSLGTSYSMTSLGIGNFLSTLLLSTVSHVTVKHGGHGWIQNNLNASHLDYYYGFFACLNVLNLIFFLIISRFYTYKAEVSITETVRKERVIAMETLRSPKLEQFDT